jgi:hypothetical protein
MTPEGKVKREIKKYLDALTLAGEVYYFMPVQQGFGKATLDFIICYKGRFFAIETKKPDPKHLVPKMTPRQDAIAAEMRLAGGVAIACSGVEAVKAMLKP